MRDTTTRALNIFALSRRAPYAILQTSGWPTLDGTSGMESPDVDSTLKPANPESSETSPPPRGPDALLGDVPCHTFCTSFALGAPSGVHSPGTAEDHAVYG
jgi:hypothetical protein